MTATGELQDWSVTAINLAQHASNPIHTDAGAQAAGFPRALVAGVSSYALMTHVPTAAWGDAWLNGGGAHVRFGAPVFDGDAIDFVVVDDATIELRVGGERRAGCELMREGPTMATRDGERLETRTFTPRVEWSDYGDRLGDSDGRYGERRLIHPAAWVAFANDVFHTQLVNGSWIHTRSLVAYHGTVTLGDAITIETTVIDRFTSRAGKRAIADVRITSGGRPVASIEHEAVIELEA
jgi:acyl dehydratase